MRKFYFLVATAAIIFLYLLSFFSHPLKIDLKDLWRYNGKEVLVEGIVKNKIGNLIEISDGEARARVYFEDNKGIEYGDLIRAKGKVGEYGDSLVVYAKEITILKKWNASCISLPYLAENFENYIGMNVNVTGYVYSKYLGYFYITDEFGEYKIKVFYNETISFEKYDKVYVKALFNYNSKNFNFYLSICKPYHGVRKYE